MGGTWWFRFVTIVGLTLGAVWMLVPSFVGDTAQEKAQAAVNQVQGESAEETPAADLPAWYAYLPDTALVLGLDLQGGIDLTLDVDVFEAVLSTVARDVDPLKDYAVEEGIEVADVRRVRGEAALEVRAGEGASLDDIRGLLSRRGGGYQYASTKTDDEGDWHRFEMTQEKQDALSEQAVEQALETLRSRVNETGVKEPNIVRKGGSRINVQLPGIDNIQQAAAVIGKAAILDFYLVDEEFGEQKLTRAVQAGADHFGDKFAAMDDDDISYWLQETGRIGRNHRVLWEYTTDPEGKKIRTRPYILKDKVILTGDDINDAMVQSDQFNTPGVSLEFKPAGGRVFAEITGENVGKRFAIVLDGRIQSAPNISEKIGGGRARITMGASDYNTQLDEATVLALVLRTGALPAPVTIGEVRTVGSSLGQDSIDAGIEATEVGGVLVVLFMGLLYRNRSKLLLGLFVSPGAIAVLALGLNLVYIMALLAGFGATLTLPGIAGIALTVGMAVDANIIIFERIREELALGKAARSAVDAGFEQALSAVVDANVTTAIAGVVLYSYGTGPIKGFAVTLLVGIATTLFTAIFVSRTFMDLLVRRSSTRLAL